MTHSQWIACIATMVAMLVGPLSSHAATPPALSSPDATPELPLGPVFYGALDGSAAVSAGGNASYSVSIELPPGTAGMAPQLSLSYNSNMRNGRLGLGWFMSGANSKIARCAQNIAQDGQIRVVDYSLDDRYCMDGNRLMVVNGGTYGADGAVYRTESDNFSRVSSHGSTGTGPSHFEVRTKGGLIKYYGSIDESRIEAEGQSSTVRLWALDKVMDPAGNYYSISYIENNADGEYYPSSIAYTANDSEGVLASATVDFTYETRPDNQRRYEAGSLITPHKNRLSSIKTYVDINLVTDYTLTYEEIGVDSRSRLTQVERCDALGNCQSPITFEWLDDGAVSYTAGSQTVPYFDTDSSNYSSNGAMVGKHYNVPRWHDINGDGKPDYVHLKPLANGQYDSNYNYADQTFEIEMSGPGGYTSVSWTTPHLGHPKDFHWGDFNGDGRTDIAVIRKQGSTYWPRIAFAGDTGFTSEDWSVSPNPTWGDHHFRDMNGDNLLDQVTVVGNTYNGNYTVYVQLSTGSDFGTAQTWLVESSVTSINLNDFNGDGLMDILINNRYVHTNDGTGFAAPVDFGAASMANNNKYADYNGDGLLDRRPPAPGSGALVEYNTGTSFETAGTAANTPWVDVDDNRIPDSHSRVVSGGDTLVVFGAPTDPTTTIEVSLAEDDTGEHYTDQSWTYTEESMDFFEQWVDINGDGMLDHTLAKTDPCHSYIVQHNNYPYTQWVYCENDQLKTLTYDGKPAHLLQKVTNGLGAETVFTYKPLTDSSVYTKGTGAALPVMDIQDSTYVVSHLSQSDGLSGTFDTDYTYEGLKHDYSGRGRLGFAKITVANIDKGTTTETAYGQAYPYASQPTLVEVKRTSDGQLLSRTDTTYSVHGTIGNGPVFPYVDARVVEAFNLADASLMSTSTTVNHCDAYGNVNDSTVTVVDHVNTQTFKTQTLKTFAVDPSAAWRIAQNTQTTVKKWLNGSNDPNLDRTDIYTYFASTGLLESTTREPGGGTGIELTTTFGRDGFGNVTTETISGPGITTRTTTTAYDARGQFPISVTNALNHQATLTWNSDFGTKATTTDANGLLTSWTYNGFGQQTLETRPDSTTTTSLLYEDPANNQFYVETLSSGKAPTRQFIDRLGRKTRARTQGFGGAYVNQDTEYDSEGRAWRSSEPYFDGDPVVWSTSTYDDLDRVTSFVAADPVQSTTTFYSGYAIFVSDALNRTTIKVYNAIGQVFVVQDDAGTDMVMAYDAAGNRIQVINALGTASQSAVTYTYDRLGRLLVQNDPDHGQYLYGYDALGQKTAEVSPKMAAAGQGMAYAYDVLGRKIARLEPEGWTVWSYDDTANGNLGLGQLHSETHGGMARQYTYGSNDHGRLTSTTTSIDGALYTTNLTYDALGRVATQQYPSGTAPFTVEYTYNALGYQERVQEPGGSQVYYQLVQADASGRMIEEWQGDGSTTVQSYEANANRIYQQASFIGAAPIQSFSYDYDDAGNMIQREDLVHNLTEDFTFDNLDRLTGAHVTGATAATYGFDVTGNITLKSETGNPYAYTSAAVHAVTQITAGTVVQNINYDSNGNLMNGDDVPHIAWTTYNKPSQLSKAGSTYDFAYGSDRKRYKKTLLGVTTHYVGTSFEKIIAGSVEGFRYVVRANGKAIMLRKTSTTTSAVSHEYIHRDHLDSVTALTREIDGSVIERLSYDAWGKRRSATDWTTPVTTASDHRGYTGHEHLDDIGIIHMNGRVYDPRLGRMLSPDPVTQAPENGQNYNRYTYAYNNPLKYTDPSGYKAARDRPTKCISDSCSDAAGVGADGSSSSSGSERDSRSVGARGATGYDAAGNNTFVTGTQVAWATAAASSNSPMSASGDVVGTDGAVNAGSPVVGTGPDWWTGYEVPDDFYHEQHLATVVGIGISYDVFRYIGFGFDAGLYYDYETGNVGYFLDGHFGFGYDMGIGVTIQLTDDPENFGGSFVESEASVGPVEAGYTFENTPSGQLDGGRVNTINIGTPSFGGHLSKGSGITGCIVCIQDAQGNLQ